MSTSVQQVSPTPVPVERRFYPRAAPNSPIFLSFDELHESLLLNISENGLLISTPGELSRDSVARLSIGLSGLGKPVQVHVRVIWTNAERKLAGIQLLDLSEHDRERIRKWAARESAQLFGPNRTQAGPITQPAPAISETLQVTGLFTEEMRAYDARNAATADCMRATLPRKATLVERSAIAGLYLAAAALVAVFFLRNAAMGNPFAHASANQPQITKSAFPAPLAGAQESSAAPVKENLNIAERASAKIQTPNSPVQSATRNGPEVGSSQPLVSRRQSSADRHPEMDSPDVSEMTASIDAPSEDSSSLPQIPPPADASAESLEKTAPEITSSLSTPPDSQPLSQSPTTTIKTATGSFATVLPSASAPPHLNSMAAPARQTLSPNSAPNVIHMDPPRNQTLEVHLSSGYQSSFFGLPGQRVLETSAITTSIQRFVLMPSIRGGWFASHNKKVVVGELISRVDPRPAQLPSAATVSVRIQAVVAKDGHIETVRLISGPADLVPVVTRALREWRYQPTLVDDRAVKTQSDVIFQFHPPTYRAAKR